MKICDRNDVDSIRLIFVVAAFLSLISMILFIPATDYNLHGIVDQVTVIISVYMTISMKRRGFIAAAIINGIQMLRMGIYILTYKALFLLPGIIVPITTLMIIGIIERYSYNLEKKVDEAIEQQLVIEKNARRVKRMANYDALTGALNRGGFIRKLDSLCKIAGQEPFALALMDIDGFKNINDTMGHQIGDSVLRTVSENFRKGIHPEDVFGRLGGDEFALIIRRDLDEQTIPSYLSEIMESLKKVEVGGCCFAEIRASFGVAFCPKDSADTLEMIKYADTAMYSAKKSGKNRIEFFTEKMKEDLAQRIEIERSMMTALEKNELSIVFQPQYSIEEHRLFGFEALARWKSPELGDVSPALFIPLAECNGLIHQWGKWVLEEACRVFVPFRDELMSAISLAVNISAKQINEYNFPELVKGVLTNTGMPAKDLQLEITESSFISDPKTVSENIRQLKVMGVSIALDDFGKHYSSPYLLQLMPIDTLKIDKDYIQNMSCNKISVKVVDAIIDLSHKMGLKVVAEGVETEEQLQYLKDSGCDYLQGYLWGKPVPIDILVEQQRLITSSIESMAIYQCHY